MRTAERIEALELAVLGLARLEFMRFRPEGKIKRGQVYDRRGIKWNPPKSPTPPTSRARPR